jgi:hypothetical protein
MGITMDIEAEDGNEPLELTEAQETAEVGFEDEQQGEQHEEALTEPEPETEIGFGDEGDVEADDTPLVRKLRDQLRQAQRQLKQGKVSPADEGDPEPAIPSRPSLEALEYDQDRFDAALEERDAAVQAHAEWKVRQADRDRARQRIADEQAKTVEQQRKALGVSDYEARAAAVKDRLSDGQLAVLINGAENPAKLIYALGRSETKLEELAGIDNLARFAARVGQLERDVKVSKRTAPAPESRVRGATASVAVTSSDKELAKLEAEADKTGDRSKVIQYRRQMRAQQAA